MKLITVKSTEYRLARAWYVKYPLDAYAMGPYRYNDPVPASVVIEQALSQFGERPAEVWPEGETLMSTKLEIELDQPEDD